MQKQGSHDAMCFTVLYAVRKHVWFICCMIGSLTLQRCTPQSAAAVLIVLMCRTL